MLRLKRSLLLLLVFLAVFLNIERLDFGEQNLLDIQSIVYVLVLISVGAIIIIPALGRAHWLVPGASAVGLYLIERLVGLFVFSQPVIGGLHTYLFFTELSFVVLGVLLAHLVARHLHEFEEVVKNITLSDVSHRVRKLDEAMDDVQFELIRSRRHHYPLSLVVVKLEPRSVKATLNQLVQEVQQAMMQHYVLTSLARMISLQLRRTDIVLDDQQKNRFIILSPDTDTDGLLQMVDRLQTMTSARLGVTVQCGIASFPNSALTFEDLVQQAEDHIHGEEAGGVSAILPQATSPVNKP